MWFLAQKLIGGELLSVLINFQYFTKCILHSVKPLAVGFTKIKACFGHHSSNDSSKATAEGFLQSVQTCVDFIFKNLR